ncbi:MAG: hypothetical protein ACTTKL_11615 [Treponema sp.]
MACVLRHLCEHAFYLEALPQDTVSCEFRAGETLAGGNSKNTVFLKFADGKLAAGIISLYHVRTAFSRMPLSLPPAGTAFPVVLIFFPDPPDYFVMAFPVGMCLKILPPPRK